MNAPGRNSLTTFAPRFAEFGKIGKANRMGTATISTKGHLVIPSRFRKALHLRAGDKVAFSLEGDNLFSSASRPGAPAAPTENLADQS